jgi:hypothetical protein
MNSFIKPTLLHPLAGTLKVLLSQPLQWSIFDASSKESESISSKNSFEISFQMLGFFFFFLP